MYSCYLDRCFQKSKIILTAPLTAGFIKTMETHFVYNVLCRIVFLPYQKDI